MRNSQEPGAEERDQTDGKSSSSATPDEAVSFPIVGIGASAGGLNAFTRMLKALPPDTGMAFVLVQHLDPGHDSLLTELLSRDAKMPVTQVEDGMRVNPDHVYVIPPNANMALYHGRLNLLKRGPGLNLPVDSFFLSLAQEQGERAVGVVLSGTGTDGSRGLREIKTRNGVTFAQDSQSADYDGMPSAAVSSGAADFVMPPEQIAEMLEKISRHPFLARETVSGPPPETEGQEEQLARIFMLLRAQTGADFAYYKRSTLQRRIARRMAILRVEGLEDYVIHLENNPAEAEQLFQDILIHVTSFFREPKVFDLLKTKVFPSIMKHKGPATAMRIWVPGCATGEEAYSIAIEAAEFTEGLASRPGIQIFATDLDGKAIERARIGLYSADALAEVSEERLLKYFNRLEQGYQVNQLIREMCIFARHDILQNPPFSHMDLVSFRNVLIYMERVLQKNVIPTLGYALEPWGFLLLGSSEHIDDSSGLFHVVDKKHQLYAKNPASGRGSLTLSAPMNPLKNRGFVDNAAHGAGKARPGFDPQKEADSIVMSRHAPAGVLVNEKMQVIQFRGDTGRFLTPAAGRASFDLLAMAREGLSLEIRAAVDGAKRSGEPVSREGVQVKLYDQITDLRLEVIPIKSPLNESYFLILFKVTGKKAAAEPGEDESREPAPGTDEAAAMLRRELETTKQYLLSVIEEKEEVNERLGAANEEVQSSNEELLSINEEMETAREELQSANEELTTLNRELQNRNLDLGQLNDDFENVRNSIGVPMILLTSDLRIRHVTPAADKVLNISQADAGKPLGSISLFADSPDLGELAAEVIRSVTPVKREVQTKDGRRFSLLIRPYKTRDNRIDGAVLTCEDITDLWLSLEMSNIFLEASNILAETHDLDKLLVSLLKVIDKAIPGCRAIVNLIDSEKGEVEAIAAVGSPVFLHKKLKLDDIAPDSGMIHEKKPVLVDYDSFPAVGPTRTYLLESNSRVVLYVPMVSRNQVIGVISVDIPGERHEFSEREVELLAGIASPAAMAIENAQLYRSSKHIASVLQEALLSKPEDLPRVEFDYLYRSATEAARVGGDFYDVFELDDSRIGIIIGDVAGKGVGAASFAAHANFTIKAYAYEYTRPDLVMKLTNKVLTMTRSNADFVTIFFGVLDIDTGALAYCSGGHPPALITTTAGEVRQLGTVSPIVGAFTDVEFKSGEDRLGKGDLLVLYTDGTIEAKRGQELFGLQRLIEIVKTPKFRTPILPRNLTDKIFTSITDFTGGELVDDVAILALRLKVGGR